MTIDEYIRRNMPEGVLDGASERRILVEMDVHHCRKLEVIVCPATGYTRYAVSTEGPFGGLHEDRYLLWDEAVERYRDEPDNISLRVSIH